MLRTALTLSCVTGKPFRMINIRKRRAKPGLMRQHQVAVQSAARIAGAQVSGDSLGSAELTFSPGAVVPGNYSFDIGTAGATTMVLQTLIPALLLSPGKSRLSLIGGTHVPFSPSWQYLAEVYARALRGLGAELELDLERVGFYPKGGGRVRCSVHPAQSIAPLAVETRGELVRVSGCSVVANLPRAIAERQARSALSALRVVLGSEVPMELEVRETPAYSPGTFIFLKGEYRHAVAGFAALGERGKPAEAVGADAAAEFLEHHETGMPIDPHLADQLVPFLALAAGPSVIATSRITNHLETNLMVTGKFLEFKVEVTGAREEAGVVRITKGELVNGG